MNKSELTRKLAEKTNLSRAEASRAVDAIFSVDRGIIADALSRGEKVEITGFGSFEARGSEAGTGRNPRAGEDIRIGASKSAALRAGAGRRQVSEAHVAAGVESEERRSQTAEMPPRGRVVDRLDHIVRALGSDAALARALDVSRAQPRRWRAGQEPEPHNRDRLVGLDAVIALLSGYLAESSIPKWLNGVNAHLGDRRPISVLREGRISDVIAAIEAEKGGGFT